MRVLVLSLLVALASASCSVTPADTFKICLSAANVPASAKYFVSQADPKSSGATSLDDLGGVNGLGQKDCRNTGTALGTAFTQGDAALSSSWTAPYSGCFYFYSQTQTNGAYPLYGKACTQFAEWSVASGRSDVAPKFYKPTQTVGAPSVYSLTLTYEVDAMYAGWAFEFLNLNVAKTGGVPMNSNTRCGISFDDMNGVNSPHGTYTINNPANGAANSANGKWNILGRSYTTGGLANVTYTVQDFNNALINCGWFRDESNTAFTLFKATIRATGVTMGKSLRGSVTRRTSETFIDIAIQFNTAVSATSGALYVNSPLVLYSEVTKQVFDPVSKQAYLMLFTSSQGPYQLSKAASSSFVCSSATDAGCKTWTGVTAPTFTPFGGSSQQDLLKDTTSPTTSNTALAAAECYSPSGSSSVVPDYNAQSPTAFTECRQYWFIQLNALNDCGSIFATTPAQRTLNGQWTASFSIGCHSSYKGSCNIQAPIANTVSITFNTASDNYCPQIVDTVTSSAVLNVYEDAGYSITQSQFVFGTNSYFKATVTSSVRVEAVYTEEIAVTLGYKSSNVAALGATAVAAKYATVDGASTARQIIYVNPFPSTIDASFVDAYFSGGEGNGGTCSGRSGLNSVPSTWNFGAIISGNGNLTTTCHAPQTGGAAILNFGVTQVNLTGQASLQLNSGNNFFQWYWNEAISGATGDFAIVTQVNWKGRVRYADQSTKRVEATYVPKYDLASTAATTASVTSSISGAPAASTDGSSAAVSTTTIAVAAAAVAAIAVMAIAAFVVLRSRNTKMETETNLESVTLGSMGSSAQLSA